MTDGRIPEGRKPLTDADIAALTRRLAGTAVDYKELYEAAKRDAEKAEAYAASLESDMKALTELLREAREDLAAYVDADYPPISRAKYPDIQRRWHRDIELCSRIDATLAELKGQADDTDI